MGSYSKMIRWAGLLGLLILVAILSPVSSTQAADHDNDIWWSHLGHNSRDTLYRNPGKAVPTGTEVTLRLRAADGDLTAAQVRVWNDRLDQQHFYDMTKVASGVMIADDAQSPYEFWEVTLPASDLPTVYWYRFIAIDGSKTVYYEDDDGLTGGWGQVFEDSQDNSYQLTIYDPDFQTPDWVKNAVFYQIFPDRFRDGDPSNNPTANQFFYGAFDTIVRSNTDYWNSHICDPRSRPGSAAICADRYSQNFYGGDLQGIIDQLDYLQELGITALYLNPIFESPSNHKYDTKDFMLIDDHFGDLALFQQLVAAADARGMDIVLDGVFNHSSSDSVYFDRYSRWDAEGDPTTLGANDGSGACESTASPFVDWYTFFNYTGGGTPPCSNNRDYPKWFGIFDSLPVFQHDNPEVRDYFIGEGNGAAEAVGPYWIEKGAAGWRLDVAPEVDHGTINDPSDDYWETFREAVKSVYPDAYIVGEEWGNSTSWTIGGEWDASMNYQFGAALLSFWRDSHFSDNDFNDNSSAGPLNPLDAAGVTERLLNLEERYPPEAFAAMMNLFNSHDTNRVLFLLDHNNGGNDTGLYNNPNYDWSDAIGRYQGALILQMTLPGAPTIYYGDEVGAVSPPAHDGSVWQDDPYNRVPYPWLDETGTPFYAHLQEQSNQDDLYNYVATLTTIRNNFSALRTGSFDPFDTGNPNVFAYGRTLTLGSGQQQTLIVLANKSDKIQNVTIALGGYVPNDAAFQDLLTVEDDTFTLDGFSNLIIDVPARGGRILLVDGAYTLPSAVTDLTATAISDSSIELKWSAADGATDYEIYRTTLSGGGYEYIGSTNLLITQDDSLTTGQTYYYVVVSRTNDGLLSGWSNEASATPFIPVGGGWRNLQWPPTLNHPINATDLTADIYGQIYIAGFTEEDDVTPTLLAQVGYGDTNDVNDGTWQWFDMVYHMDVGNNDEFIGNLPRVKLGTSCYTTRYSGDGGITWFYADNAPIENDETCLGAFGVLTITSSSDTTAPAAPTGLSASDVTSASISLAWDSHPNTDGDLHGFRVYRGPAGGPYNQIAQINNSSATSYVDTNVTADTTYEYYITAIDTSLNESGPSNKVEATAENLVAAVTFRVTVPDPTPGTVYLAGNFPFTAYPQWDPAGLAMTEVSDNVWEITLQIPDGVLFYYKYTRGTWDTVEKQTDGNQDIDNRESQSTYGQTGEQLVTDTVANWRDPFITSHTPADGATGVDPATEIVITWNQAMPLTVGRTFTGPHGVIGVTVDYNATTYTHTFTPDDPLAPGSYTFSVSGNADVVNDAQQVATSFSFEVDVPDLCPEVPGNLITNPCFEDGSAPWKFHSDGHGTYDVSPTDPGQGDGSAEVSITQAGSNVQFFQSGIQLKGGTGYELSFVARSNNGQDMSVFVHQHGAPFASYGLSNFHVNLTDTWAPYSITFTTPNIGNVNDGRLRFWLAPYSTSGDVYYIDHVVLRETADAPPVEPPPPPPPLPELGHCDSPVPGNVLLNPGFEAQKNSWKFANDGVMTFTTPAKPNITPFECQRNARIQITTQGNSVQLYQTGFTLLPDTDYYLRFAARSSNGRNASLFLHQHSAPYTNYGLNGTVVDLTSNWQVFEVTFRTNAGFSETTDTRLRFWLSPFDADGMTYEFDDVVLMPQAADPVRAANATEVTSATSLISGYYIDAAHPDRLAGGYVGEVAGCRAARVGLSRLWPANNKMKAVTITNVGTPQTLTILGVWQDEPVGPEPDAVIGADGVVYLRAERDLHAGADGRVYTIQFRATYANGQSCDYVATVGVPLTNGRGMEAVNGGGLFGSLSD